MNRPALLFAPLLALAACNDPQDPDYLWLLSLSSAIDPAAAAEQAPAPLPAPHDEIPFEIQVGDVTGDPGFVLDTTRQIALYVDIIDATAAPLSGARVRVFEMVDGVATENSLLFYARTTDEGNASGVLTVNRATPIVLIDAEYQGQELAMQVDLTQITELRRRLVLTGVATPQPSAPPDTDGDGSPDGEDQFPYDPDRAVTILQPTAADGVEYYTVAYEDLYPKQGDADFNDYVVRVRYETDLNAQGKLARLRGYFQHVAKGAGYDHTLHLNLAALGRAHVALRRYDAADGLVLDQTQLQESVVDLELLPRSNVTLARSNTAAGQAFVTGWRAELEIIPELAIETVGLGSAPYDLFVKVLNTGHEIHFPRRYFDAEGKDRYVDGSGFPWAFLVPGDFAWPLERADIRSAYADFNGWYLSQGMELRDWYTRPDASRVFITP